MVLLVGRLVAHTLPLGHRDVRMLQWSGLALEKVELARNAWQSQVNSLCLAVNP